MGSGGVLLGSDASLTPVKVVDGDPYAVFGGDSTQVATVECTTFGAVKADTVMARHIPSCIHGVGRDLLASINNIKIVDLVPKSDTYIDSNYNALLTTGGTCNSLSTYRYMTTVPLAASCLYDMVKYVDARLDSFQTATMIQGLVEGLIQATAGAVLEKLWGKLFGTVAGAALQAAIDAAAAAAAAAGTAAADAAAAAADVAAQLAGQALHDLVKGGLDMLTDEEKAGVKGAKGDKGDTGDTGAKGDTGATGAAGAGWFYPFPAGELSNDSICGPVSLYTTSAMTIYANALTGMFTGTDWLYNPTHVPDTKLIVQGKIKCSHLNVTSGEIGVPASGVRFVTGDPIDQFLIDPNGSIWTSGRVFAGNGLYVEMKVPSTVTLAAASPSYTHGVDVFTFQSMQGIGTSPVSGTGAYIYSATPPSSANHGGYSTTTGSYTGSALMTSGTPGDWEGVTCSIPFLLDGWTIKYTDMVGFKFTSTFGSNDGGVTWTLVDVFDASDPSETGLHGGKCTIALVSMGVYTITREFSNTTEYSSYRVVFHSIQPVTGSFRILNVQWLCILDPLALTASVSTSPPSAYNSTQTTYVTGPISSGSNTVNGDLAVSGSLTVNGVSISGSSTWSLTEPPISYFLLPPIYRGGAVNTGPLSVHGDVLSTGCVYASANGTWLNARDDYDNSLASLTTQVDGTLTVTSFLDLILCPTNGTTKVTGALSASSVSAGSLGGTCISDSTSSTSSSTAASSAAVKAVKDALTTLSASMSGNKCLFGSYASNFTVQAGFGSSTIGSRSSGVVVIEHSVISPSMGASYGYQSSTGNYVVPFAGVYSISMFVEVGGTIVSGDFFMLYPVILNSSSVVLKYLETNTTTAYPIGLSFPTTTPSSTAITATYQVTLAAGDVIGAWTYTGRAVAWTVNRFRLGVRLL
jgi:hypothetical protein